MAEAEYHRPIVYLKRYCRLASGTVLSMAQAPASTQRRALPRATVRRDELIDELITLVIHHGFLDLSIEDLARQLKRSKSTLYSVADSKEQIFVAIARAFFRLSTARIEEKLSASDERANRIDSYLQAISAEFASASPQFFSDLDQFAPTREIYRANMKVAAERVQELVLEAVPETSRSDATFVGTVAGQIMEAIHRGEIEQATDLDRPAAYQALAGLLVAAVSSAPQPSPPRQTPGSPGVRR